MAPFDGLGRSDERHSHIEWSRSKYRSALTSSASRAAFLAGGQGRRKPAHPEGRQHRLEPLEPRILLSADLIPGLDGITDDLTAIDTDLSDGNNDDGGLTLYVEKIRELIRDSAEFGVEAPGLRANAGDVADPLVPIARDLLQLDFDQIEEPNSISESLSLILADKNSDDVIDHREIMVTAFIEPLRDFLENFGDIGADGVTPTPAPAGQKYVPDDGDILGGGQDDDDNPDLAPLTLSDLLNGYTDLGPTNDAGDNVAVQGLTDFLINLEESTFLSDWFDVSVSDVMDRSSGAVIQYDLTLSITVTSEYLIDLGLEADLLEITLPDDPTVDVEGSYSLPFSFRYDTVSDVFSIEDRDGPMGDDDLLRFEVQINETFTGFNDFDVNVGFLGTTTVSESFFKLSIPYTAEMIDPSSPFHIGFEVDEMRLDGSGELTSADGDLIALAALDPTFSTNILFELKIGANGADSPSSIMIDVDPADVTDAQSVVDEIQADIDAAFGGPGGPLVAMLDGGMLKITLNSMEMLDATIFGFSSQENFDSGTLLAGGSLSTDNAIAELAVDADFSFSGAFLLSIGGAQPVLVNANFTAEGGGGGIAQRRMDFEDKLQAAVDAAAGGMGVVDVTLNGDDTITFDAVTANTSLEITRTLAMMAEHVITTEELLNAAGDDLFLLDLDASNDNHDEMDTDYLDLSDDKWDFTLKLTLDPLPGVDINAGGAPSTLLDGESITITRDMLITDNGAGGVQFEDISEPDDSGFIRFDGNDIDLSDDFGELLNFTNLGAYEVINLFAQLKTWLNRLPASDIFGDFGIPFTEGSLSDLFTFGDAISDDLLDVGNLLVDEAGFLIASFDTVQELGKRLAELGVFGDGFPTNPTNAELATRVKYDVDTKNLTYHIEVDVDTSAVVDLDYDIEFEPLASASVDGEIEIAGALKFEALFGVDLNTGTPITPASSIVAGEPGAVNNGAGVDINDAYAITSDGDVNRIFGRLSGDATFDVSINGGSFTPITITELLASDNNDIQDLVDDINLVIAGTPSLNGLVEATSVGDRISIQAADPSVTEFAISVATNDPAYREIGLRTTAATTVFLVGEQVDNVPELTGTLDITIEVNGGTSPSITITGFDLENGGDGYNTLNDLIDDLNVAIAANDGVSDQQVFAARNGNAIVLTAADSAVGGFAITSGSNLASVGLDITSADVDAVAGIFLVGDAIFDLDDLGGDKQKLQFGRLTATQTFSITVNTTDGVKNANFTITEAETAEFRSIIDLAALINDKLAALAPGNDVGDYIEVATVGSNRLVLSANDGGVTSISIDTTADELGLVSGASVSPTLMATADRIAPFYYGPAEDAVFTIDYELATVAQTPVQITVSAAEAADNDSFFKLVNDVNRALNDAFGAGSNPFIAEFDGNRLVIKARASFDVTGFSITADSDSVVDDLKLVATSGGTTNADTADFLIFRLDGSVDRIDLDSATDLNIGDVLSAINDNTTGLLADITSNGLSLFLNDTAGGTDAVLRVVTLHGSDAAFDLGLVVADQAAIADNALGVNAGTLDDADATLIGDIISRKELAERLFLRRVDASTDILSAGVEIRTLIADDPATAEVFEGVAAKFGFVGIELETDGMQVLRADVGINLRTDANFELLTFDPLSDDINQDGVVDVFDLAEIVTFPSINLPAETSISFAGDDASVVNVGSDVLNFENHGFQTGEKVVYSNGGGTDIGGLTDGASYYVFAFGPDILVLFENADDALSIPTGTPVPITGLGAGAGHTLTVDNVVDFNIGVSGNLDDAFFGITGGGAPQVGLEVVTLGDPINLPDGALVALDPQSPGVVSGGNEINFAAAHGFDTGNKVVYRNGGGTDIGGLIDGETYYIIRVDSDTIRLADSLGDAEDGTALTLDVAGMNGDGANHRLQGFNPLGPDINVLTNDLEDLLNFGQVSFDNIFDILRQAADFLEQFVAANTDFLEVEIPVLGVSIAELVDVAQGFIDAVDDISNNPPGDLQELTQKILESFGILPDPEELAPPPPFTFALVDDNDEGGAGMDGQTQDMLQVVFDFDKVFSEALDFNFELGEVLGGAGDFLGDVISLTGNTGLGASGGFFAILTLGVDLDQDASDETGVDPDQFGEVFIFDHPDKSSLAARIEASSADVNFNASIGPVGASIIGGDAIFAAGIEFSNTSVTDLDSRKSLFDDFAGAFSGFGATFTEGASGKAIDITLPVYIPTPSDYIGDITFSADLEPDGTFTFGEPSFPDDLINADFLSQFDIFTSIPLMIDAIDLLLGTVQDVLQGEILGFELPFIEKDTFGDAVQFIEDIRIDFIDPFSTLFESTPKNGEELAELLQAFIFGLIGPGFDNLGGDLDKQAFIDLFPELQALADVFPAFGEGLGLFGDVDFNDFTTDGLEAFLASFIPLDLQYEGGDPLNDIIGVQWDFEFTGKVNPAINAAFDFGLPALGFDIDGGLGLELTYGFGIGFGIALDKGAYIDIDSRSPDMAPNSVPDLQLTLEAGFAPDSTITGRLGFLQLSAAAPSGDSEAPLNGDPAGANGIADDARLRASFAVDLVSDEAPDGRLAFFDIGSLDFEVLVEAEADLIATLRLGFNDQLLPDVASAVFPALQADFEFAWSTGGEQDLFNLGDFDFAGGLERVAFTNIYLDLGSFLGDFLGEIVAQIQEVTAPLQPIIDILTAPIPVVSDLAGQPISLVDIAAAFGEFDPSMIYAIADLITFVNSIPEIDPNDPAILLPIADDFILVGSGIFGTEAGKDALTSSTFKIADAISEGGEFFDAFNTEALSAIAGLAGDFFGEGGFDASAFSSAFDSVGNTSGSSAQAASAASNVLGGNFNSGGGGFAFPFLENPSSILGALLGQPIVLVTYDLPPFVVDFNWEQSFPIYPPLYALIGVGVGVKIDLAFGYDTLGVQEFIEGGAQNPLDLLRGLYISDTVNPDGSGADVPELQLFGSISVGAELNAGVAKAGVAADIILTVNFDLNDPDGDGRVRIDELVGNFLYEFNYGSPALAPIAIFDVGGEISLQLRAFIEILLVIDLEFEITPPIVLFEFQIEFDREPFLATERSDGTILLNIGPNADSRQHGNTDDIAELINVEYVGNGEYIVWSDQFNVSKNNAQRYSGNRIVADGGEFGDTINLFNIDVTNDPDGLPEFELIGGSGNDTITVDADSDGSGLIEGNDGDDMLLGGSGDETIIGGEGGDMIVGGAGADLIFGDLGRVSERLISGSVGARDGEDDIAGGDGDDTIFGGGGRDRIGGDGKTSDGPDFDDPAHGNDLIFGDGARIILAEFDDMGVLVDIPDEIRSTEGFLDQPDIIHGHGANDTVYGGRGDDSIDGGADNDHLFGETGFDLIEGGGGDDFIEGGDNNDYLYGFRQDLSVGNSASDGKDTIHGGDGGDFIRGNGDMDELFGERGADIIFGDAGDDFIEGGSFNDTIFGGADSDTVQGGAGNDIVFGDDGLVVYFDFGEVPAAVAFDEDIARPGNIIGDADGDAEGITGVPGSTSDDRMIGDVSAPVLGSFVHDGVGNTLDLIYTAVNVTDGDDFVNGGEGDDIIIGGAGDDQIFGDFVTNDPGTAPIPVGEDILFGDAGRVEFQKRLRDRIMSVVGPIAGNDTLSGNGGEDVLFGGGNDLGAGTMKDVLYGRHDESVVPAGDVTRVNIADADVSDDDIIIGDDGIIDYFFIQEDGASNARVFSAVETIFTLFETDADLTGGIDPAVTGGVDEIFGSKGNDTLFGGFAGDLISGDGPSDMGEDVAIGDNGRIDYRVEIATADGVFIPGDAGLGDADDDIDSVTSEIELVYATDTTNASGGSDTISGSALNDIIIGGADADLLTGGDEDDIVIGDNAFLDYRSGSDPDRIGLDLIRTNMTELLGATTYDVGGNDTISGGGRKDIVVGGAGGDFIFGDDTILDPMLLTTQADANADEDILIGDQVDIHFNDTAFATGSKVPAIIFIDTTDITNADGGVDDIRGNEAIDVILGGVQGDILRGNQDDDIILGDEGLVWYDAAARAAANQAALGIINSMAGVAQPLATDANVFTVDFIETTDPDLGGNDWIFGNEDDDIALGGTGADNMYGDNDTADFTTFFLPTGPAGQDILVGDQGRVTLINAVDAMTGLSSFAENITRIESTDAVEADGGADNIEGNDGSDILIGGVQADNLHGESLLPTLVGTGGNDLIVGDEGIVRFDVLPSEGIVGAGDELSPGVSNNATLDLVRTFKTGETSNDANFLGAADNIFGNDGADVVFGGTDSDKIYGDLFANDFATLLDSNAPGADTLLGDGGEMRFEEFEVFQAANNFNTTILRSIETGQGGQDTIEGNESGDVIMGGQNDDVLFGESDLYLALMAFGAGAGAPGKDIILGDNGELNWITAEFAIQDRPDFNAAVPVKLDAGRTTLDIITSIAPNDGGADRIEGNADDDTIIGGTAGDLIWGDTPDETPLDAIADADAGLDGADGSDLIFGDHAYILADFDPAAGGENAELVNNNFFSTFTQKAHDGFDDIIFGGDEVDDMGNVYGGDIAIGGQGDDLIFGERGDDDLIGGHNVMNGDDEIDALDAASTNALTPTILAHLDPTLTKSVNDVIDGGDDDDVIAGDNAVIFRQTDDASLRFRMTDGDGDVGQLYNLTSQVLSNLAQVDVGFTANVTNAAQTHLDMETVRTVYLLNHNDAAITDALDNSGRQWFGNDIIAGGINDDELFGQLGDDIIQGDGEILTVDTSGGAPAAQTYDPTPNAVGGPTFDIDNEGMADFAIDGEMARLTFNVIQRAEDGNDYVEGNGGNDRIYGGLGQDDLIGGSSTLFLGVGNGLGDIVSSFATDRPDGADLIYGGIGDSNILARNATAPADILGGTDNAHGRDADAILGDNGEIFQIVSAPDIAASFQFDDQSGVGLENDHGEVGYAEQLRVRAVQFADYRYKYVGGTSSSEGTLMFLDGASSVAFRGAGDLIFGETGDDIIHGQTGNDAIFGNAGDDDLYGEIGSDFLLGGTGRDGILGDDGLILTSRNNQIAEPLNGIVALDADEGPLKRNEEPNLNSLNVVITTPGEIQIEVINREHYLTKAVELFAFRTDDVELAIPDILGDGAGVRFNDIIFGGLGSDFLHGGDGDDAISGAEALSAYYGGVDFDGDTSDGAYADVNEFLERQQETTNVVAPDGPAGFSDLNARPFWFSFAPSNPGDILRFGDRDPNEFALYDEFSPRRKIVLDFDTATVITAYENDTTTTPPAGSIQFLLNFDPSEGEIDQIEVEFNDVQGDLHNDGDDVLFGDLGNDWIVGGTGRDHAYGGRGSDLLNMDDDHDSGAASPNNPNKGTNNQIENTQSDEAQAYADIFYGGAGRDVMILNTGADRSIDWVGEFNSYIVPFSPFGAFHISRNLQPQLEDYLEALSDSDGADVSATPSGDPAILPSAVDAQLYVEQKLADVRTDDPDPERNFEPFGELGQVRQEDRDWGEQTGAPDDPQPGNFQGKREIMRRELFNDATQVLFADLTGNFAVRNGKFEATPSFVGDQAKSIFYLDATIGNYVEILVDATLDKDKQGFKSNGYIIFDYQSEFDFKFAGINAATDKIEIGHFDENGWHVDLQSNMQLRSGINYELTLALHGTVATILVDGGNATTYSFADPLNNGLVGLGTDNSKAIFDNYQVQQLPPVITLTDADEFVGASSFTPLAGDWAVADGRYVGTAGASPSVALKPFDVQIFSRIWLEATLNTDGSGGVVFDYAETTGFYKFVALDAAGDQLVIGHYANGKLTVDDAFDFNVVAGRDYDLKVSLIGGSVSVEVDGVAIGGHVFASLLNDGAVGTVSMSGETSFDAVTLKTDDPQYAQAQALASSATVNAGNASASVLSAAELAAAVEEAKLSWLSTGLVSQDQLAAFTIEDFVIADLQGDLLGQHYASGDILIDANAAGFGWGASGMDLVAVVTHEIGHALGFEHGDAAFGAIGEERLGAGEHPTLAAFDQSADIIEFNGLQDSVTANLGIDAATSDRDADLLNAAILSEAHRAAQSASFLYVLDETAGDLNVRDLARDANERRWNREDYVDLLSDDFDLSSIVPNRAAMGVAEARLDGEDLLGALRADI